MSGRPETEGVIPGRFALSVGMPDLPAPDGWQWTKLTDVARLESGHTPSRRKPGYWDGDIPWIGIKDARVHHGRVIEDTLQHTTPLGIENSAARLLPAGTVCLSRTASIGYILMMGRSMATSQDFVNWVCGPEIDPRFLMMLLIAEEQSLWSFASGTTHQTIYFPEVKAFHVCLPPLSEQRRIAAILGALGDKIEANRRMNRTLEKLAQTLFCQRFVDFSGSDDLVDSGTSLGEIPAGWRAGTLADLSILNPESWTPRTAPDQITYLALSDANWGDYNTPARLQYADAPGRARRVLRDGDTLFGQVRPANGSFALVQDAEPNLTGSTGFVVLRPQERAAQHFVYLWATRTQAVDYFASVAVGSAYPAVSPDIVHRLAAPVPPLDVLNEFDSMVRPLFNRIAANRRQSRTLAALRDALLPELVSGRLRVPMVEEMENGVE